jgi:N-acetylneuraminic acid mutarotase
MRKVVLAVGALLLPLALILVPLSALVELPLEKDVKEALGVSYPKSCADWENVGKGDNEAWREEKQLPTLRDEPRGVLIGDSVYLAGGSEDVDGPRSVATFERYDFATGRYESLPELPQRLNHVGLTAYRGDVYLVGGFGDGVPEPRAVAHAWRYDVDGRRWEEMPDMPTARGALALAVVGDRMYAIGGRDPRGELATDLVEIYDFESGEWSEGTPMRTARDHMGATVSNGMIYAVGGRAAHGNAYTDFARYDPRADEWEELPRLPYPASGIGLAEVGGKLVTAGGEDPGRGRLIGYSWAFAEDAGRWQRLPSMNKPKHGYTAVGYDGRFWAFGGSPCYGFDPDTDVSSLGVARG